MAHTKQRCRLPWFPDFTMEKNPEKFEVVQATTRFSFSSRSPRGECHPKGTKRYLYIYSDEYIDKEYA